MALFALPADMSLSGILLLAIFIAWAFWYGSYLYNALVVSPLRKVPGPLKYIFFGSYAHLWDRYFARGGHVPHEVRNLQHYKYGPVVRTSANGVSVADPDLALEVLVRQDYPKSQAASDLFKPLNPGALVAIIDKADHKRTRRFMSQRFSVQGIANMEGMMQGVYLELQNRMFRELDEAGGRKRMNIWELIHCAGIDTIGETSFGKSFNSVNEAHARVVDLVEDSFKYISTTSAFPMLRKMGFLPLNKIQEKRQAEMVELCTRIIKEKRLKLGSKEDRDDIVRLLVDGTYPDGEHMEDFLIVSNMLLMLTAGSDSTAGAMSFFMINLMQNPEWMKKVVAEVDAAPWDANGLVPQQVTKEMPIFTACVKESLRLATGRDFQRVAPEDVVLKGHFVPKGAEVNFSRYSLHRGPWWQEPDKFKPERFLAKDAAAGGKEGEEDLGRGMFAPFSLGTRNCIGLNFAWQEMRVVLANLLRHFEFEDIPGQDMRTGIWINIMLKSHKYEAYVKRRQSGKA
ncbi:cytochrome P450 [Hyaloraphidium curvatum]|nr:cytochrome P450 [Hyaloraphidium curvatum]